MLPLSSKIGFLLFALVLLSLGVRGFYRVYLRVRRGRPDTELRFDHSWRRFWYAVTTSLTQRRTFRDRRVVSFFHSLIFYGFVFYLAVNLIDAAEGYGLNPLGALGVLDVFGERGTIVAVLLVVAYTLLADVLSFLVLVGVIALVIRRFLLPARRDFNFNERTLLHAKAGRGAITRDSVIVSIFILFHVGSRAIGAGARIAAMPMDKFNAAGNDPLEPFGSLLAHLFHPANAHAWQVFGYWGALGSVLLFLAYFPYSKHIHIFAAPLKYFFAREARSGVLPAVDVNLENEEQKIGASKLEDLAWPRLLDAYACIQCNRCQDVCPATATGKSLSPAALEINKRMELNALGHGGGAFEKGAESKQTLLQMVLTPEAAWACTTCGACMQVCPVQDEQMLDIIDVRRHQVMMEGEFPVQLQAAFRGMERNQNPWGINHEQRLAWADGLQVKTTAENPEPDVLYWVGCAASYDPQAQKTARAFVQLLDRAGVDYAVLGKRECCTGDSARRAGNELLYRQLADKNVATLNEVRPKLVVASCPHCMNAIGGEYKQIGGDYKVMHHTEYLDSLMKAGKLEAERLPASIAYHDPCYLGRHNGVYEAPRNLLRVLGSEVLELERTRSNAFCCGAGGAQFWKEEEAGTERVSENRYKEVQRTLTDAKEERTLAVGCPFCKSMLGSTPSVAEGETIVIRDVAELLLAGVEKKKGIVREKPVAEMGPAVVEEPVLAAASPVAAEIEVERVPVGGVASATPGERRKWRPAPSAESEPVRTDVAEAEPASKRLTVPPEAAVDATAAPVPGRKKWSPKAVTEASAAGEPEMAAVKQESSPADVSLSRQETQTPERRKWQPTIASSPTQAAAEEKKAEGTDAPEAALPSQEPVVSVVPERKKWQPKAKS